MKKYIYSLILFLILIVLPVKQVHADEYFNSDLKIYYEIEKDGNAIVTNEIAIENKVTEKYSLQYSYLLNSVNLKSVKAFEDNQELNVIQTKKDDNTTLTLNFNEKVVGKGSKRQIKIIYSSQDFARKSGEVWEISIPKITNIDDYRNAIVRFSVPKEFGNEAYLSPNPTKLTETDNSLIYEYGKDNLESNGIVAGFGTFQVFSFKIDYHLENKKNKTDNFEIAIPPDTSYQRMYYDKIFPQPSNVETDKDGNWLAIYKLKGKERKDVNIEGSVQLFASPRKYLTPKPIELFANLKPQKYWEADDPDIMKLAKELKTPEAIYNFVTGNLKYNTEKINKKSERLGAKAVLNNRQDAICMEFTDLFIALSRAAGIPAREINGYAYTENPQIQPLSLVNDVLHSWPEYWNDNLKSWIPVDPTWDSTSGIDYFNKFDLRHFAFVIHGVNSENPVPPGSYKLGSNPQKDIFITFDNLPEKRSEDVTVKGTYRKSFFIDREVNLKFDNTGPVSVYNTSIKIFFDNKLTNTTEVIEIPPFGNFQENITIPISLLAKNTPKIIKVEAYNKSIEIPTPYNLDILFQVLSLLMLFIFIIFISLIKINKRRYERIHQI